MAYRSELSTVPSLSIVCDDCGHRKRWTGERVRSVEERYGVTSIQALGGRLRCSRCSSRGGAGDNVTVWPSAPALAGSLGRS